MKKNNPVTVVFSTDENYLHYCGVAIWSIILHASCERQYDIFILHEGLDANSIGKLTGLSVENVKVKCVDVSLNMKGLPIYELRKITRATWIRLIIPEVLYDKERVVYLDCDIIMTSDIAELFDLDLQRKPIGAMKFLYVNSRYEEYYQEIGLSSEDIFYAGLLVIDIARFSLLCPREKYVEIIKKRRYLFLDMDVLNIIFKGNVSFLPQDSQYLVSNEVYGYDVVQTANPRLIHYDCAEKPWDFPALPKGELFWHVARQTPFYYDILNRHLTLPSEVGLYDLYRRDYGMSHIKYTMPDIPQGSRVVLYGAQALGRAAFAALQKREDLEVVLWVDRACDVLKKLGMPVISPAEIQGAEYDYILVAVSSDDARRSILQVLSDMGEAGTRTLMVSEGSVDD